MDKLLTLKEAADYIGLPEEELRRLVEKGEIPAYQIGGMYLRFKEENIVSLKKTMQKKLKNSFTSKLQEKIKEEESFMSKIKDLVYFNDFYIISALLIIAILRIILKSIR